MLTDTQTAILDHEQHWFAKTGTKDTAIWETFGILPARYYQQLAALIDRDDALAYAPLLVGRLRRLKTAREAARSPRRQSA